MIKNMFVKKNREKKSKNDRDKKMTCSWKKIVKKENILLVLEFEFMKLAEEYLFVSRDEHINFFRWFFIALIFVRIDEKCVISSSHRRHNKREASFVV
jgi:hypothetical protein